MAAEYEEERKRVVELIYRDNVKDMENYLDEGGNVDFLISGLTPLCMARSVEMANFLVENGANIHFRDESRSRTPFLWQALSGHDKSPEIIKFLLKKDPTIFYDVDKNGENALHLSILRGYESSLKCAKFLLAVDPTLVNVKNKDNETPLYIVRKIKNDYKDKIIELLISTKEMLNKNPALLDRTQEKKVKNTEALLKIAAFTNKHAETARSLPWRPPKNNYSFGGVGYKNLKTKYLLNSTPAPPSTPTGERKSRKSKSRKSKNGRSRRNRKSRKSKTRRS